MLERIFALAAALLYSMSCGAAAGADYDIVVKGGNIYDGSGAAPFVGDVGIKGDRIAYVGPSRTLGAKRLIDAHGLAVAPGFINMLSQAQESIFVDGREQSDLFQGVTLEVTGEGDSMGPLIDPMAALSRARQSDIEYPVDWRTLGQYLQARERAGMSLNLASFVGATTVRQYVLGENDVEPSGEQLLSMGQLVKQAMEEGALGVSTALIYAPATFAKTDELVSLATEAGRCGGIYITHMRSEGDRLLEAVDETISIARASGAPAEIYHLKVGGQANWPKLGAVIDKIEAARKSGTRITADMYTYTAGGTGLDTSFPPWVREGGIEESVRRLRDPQIRARVAREMNDPRSGYENLFLAAGPERMQLAAFKSEALKPLTGKTLAEVAQMRHKSPEETAMDLVVEDGSRVLVVYFVMSEDNVRRETTLAWMSFGSDGEAAAPEGVFLKSHAHPRAYGNFAKLLAQYVRTEKAVTLPDAIHRLTALPAANLSLSDRGSLKVGYFADVVVFDPSTIQDHATYMNPHQLATGVKTVLVNGGIALDDGKATGAHTGRFVRGRAWTGWKGGGCRAKSADWEWASMVAAHPTAQPAALAAPATHPVAAPAATTHLINVDGHKIAFHVTPGHAPTIVLDAGGGLDSSYWDAFVPELAKRTGSQIITYDRAGFGASDEVSGAWNVHSATRDLAVGLEKLHATHGVILVSHSIAGEIATYLVGQHPDWFAGAVLVDANVPDYFTDEAIARGQAIYAPILAAIKAGPPSKPGRQLLAVADSFVETSRAFHGVSWPGSVPAIVIVSEKTPFDEPADAKWWKDAHAQFAKRAPNRRLVNAAGSSHDVVHDRPDVISRAIADISAASSH